MEFPLAKEAIATLQQRCEEIGRDPATLELQTGLNPSWPYLDLRNTYGQRMMTNADVPYIPPDDLGEDDAPGGAHRGLARPGHGRADPRDAGPAESDEAMDELIEDVRRAGVPFPSGEGPTTPGCDAGDRSGGDPASPSEQEPGSGASARRPAFSSSEIAWLAASVWMSASDSIDDAAMCCVRSTFGRPGEQVVLGVGRFGRPDVEGREADPALVERLLQRGLHDDPAARDVHEAVERRLTLPNASSSRRLREVSVRDAAQMMKFDFVRTSSSETRSIHGS